MAKTKNSMSSKKSSNTTTAKSYDPSGKGGYVGGVSVSTPAKSKSGGKTVSYYDVDGNPDTKSDGSGLKFASTPPGLKINSKGQATTSAGVISQDRRGLPVSTTTISNQNKISQVPQIINTTNKYADTGITTDENGVAKYANGTMVPDAQSQASPKVDLSRENASQGGYLGDVYYAPGANIPIGKDGKPAKLRETSVSDDKIMSNIDRLQSQSDKITASVIDSIKSNYAALKQQQEIANQQQQAGNQTALLMGGVTGQGSSSQYAPISSQNIMAATINYGISKISALASQEASAVVEAQQAGLNNNFRLMDEKNKQIERIRDEKVQATIKLNESIQKQSEKMAEESMQMTKDTAVADLVSQGITDPAAILNQLKSMGLTISAKEIDAALGVFAGNMESTLSDIRDAGVSTRFANAGGELQDARSGYRYKSEEDFLAKTGMTPQQAQDAGMVTDYTPGIKPEEDKLLSVAEAKSLGVPFGTTESEAASMGLTPGSDDEGDDNPPPEVIDAAGANLQHGYEENGKRVGGAGVDGYVSPEDYNTGLEQWLDAGYTADSYYKNYKKFVNPANPQDYNYYPKASGLSMSAAGKPVDINKALNSGGLTLDKYAKNVGTGQIMAGSNKHTGGEVDIDGKINDLIPAFEGGKVIAIKDTGKADYGRSVWVQNSRGETYICGHLNAFNVKKGQTIPKGYKIGLMGNTGYVKAGPGGDGSHLHIEKRDKNGKVVHIA